MENNINHPLPINTTIITNKGAAKLDSSIEDNGYCIYVLKYDSGLKEGVDAHSVFINGHQYHCNAIPFNYASSTNITSHQDTSPIQSVELYIKNAENKPLEWDEYMKPYREKKLFCNTVKRRIMPTYTELDIIAGLKEAGYTEYEAQHYLEVIKEKKKGSLSERVNEEE